jgi:hypothetical protein
MPFSERTARNYMRVYDYRDKTASVADLQEAYQQIETIEAQERKTEEQKQKDRILHFTKTGIKPDGWKRGTDDKKAESIKAEQQKNQEFKEKIDRDTEQRMADKKRVKDTFDEFDTLLGGFEEQNKRRKEISEKMNLSGNNAEHEFNHVLIEYLNGLYDDSERLEACHNIIKICKRYVNEYQKKTCDNGNG